jgi:hypothetical protein
MSKRTKLPQCTDSAAHGISSKEATEIRESVLTADVAQRPSKPLTNGGAKPSPAGTLMTVPAKEHLIGNQEAVHVGHEPLAVSTEPSFFRCLVLMK